MFTSQGKFHLKCHHIFLSYMYIQAQQTQERNGITRTSRNNSNLYNNYIDERCSTLKGSSIYIYLMSNFIIFFYLTCTYRHSKLKKGMEVPEHQEQLKLVYKNTILPSYFIAIETFHCPNLNTYSQEFKKSNLL